MQRPKGLILSDLMSRDTEWCASRKRPRTVEINTQALRKLIECAGDKPLDNVDRSLVERFLIRLRDDLLYSDTSINMYLRQLKAIFQRAVDEHGLLAEHPFRTVKPFAKSRQTKKATFLEVEQIHLILDSLEDIHVRRLLQFYLWTGCRRTEATDLTWDDIDWQNQQIHLGQPNSQTKLRRPFPLTDRLRGLLEELKEDGNGSNWIFWRFATDPRRASKIMRIIRERVNELPDNLTLHTLRHTFASQLVMAGVDLATVASLMGHSTTQVTEMYAHLQPGHKRAAADRLPY